MIFALCGKLTVPVKQAFFILASTIVKLYRRSLISELSNSVGSAFTVLFSIVLTIGLVRILNQTAGGRYDSSSILEVVAYSSLTNIPPLLTLALFLGVLMTLMRYWQDNEMVVWFSSGGLCLTDWIRPVLRMALPIVILIGLFSVVVSPWSRTQMAAYKDRFAAKEDVTKLSAGRFIEAQKGKRVFFLQGVDQQSGKVDNIFLLERGSDGQQTIVMANKGRLETMDNGDRYIVMTDGKRYEVTPENLQTQITDFGSYKMRVDSAPAAPTEISRVNSLPIHLLLQKDNNKAKSELFWRISWPLIALNLVLLAIPLSYNNPRVGRSYGLVAAVLIFILYLNSISIFETWIVQGKLSILSSVLLMNAAVSLLTVMLFYRLMSMNSSRLSSYIWNALCYPLRALKKEKESDK